MTIDAAFRASSHVEQCLSVIERLNPTLKAMITVTAGSARAVAHAQEEARDLAASPLAGMTVALKDVIATAGVRTTNGSEIDREWIPAADAECRLADGVVAALPRRHRNVPEL